MDSNFNGPKVNFLDTLLHKKTHDGLSETDYQRSYGWFLENNKDNGFSEQCHLKMLSDQKKRYGHRIDDINGPVNTFGDATLLAAYKRNDRKNWSSSFVGLNSDQLRQELKLRSPIQRLIAPKPVENQVFKLKFHDDFMIKDAAEQEVPNFKIRTCKNNLDLYLNKPKYQNMLANGHNIDDKANKLKPIFTPAPKAIQPKPYEETNTDITSKLSKFESTSSQSPVLKRKNQSKFKSNKYTSKKSNYFKKWNKKYAEDDSESDEPVTSSNGKNNESHQPSTESTSSFSNSKQPLPLPPNSSLNPKINTGFRTANAQFMIEQSKQGKVVNINENRRNLGLNRSYVCPVKGFERNSNENGNVTFMHNNNENSGSINGELEIMKHDLMKNLDKKLVENIMNEIMEKGCNINWEDIAGLKFAKYSIQEIVILPIRYPHLFTGLRSPSKGLLLFGPPGTGKTLIGKCIASQSESTFFNISASCLTSKWIGEGEKMVRTLFAVARVKQPSVIFIDEIDSLLTQRNDSEHESSRRMKTEFLVQFDGLSTDREEKLLVVGATNRPQELDEAARRRFVKRLYIPLPDQEARQQIITKLLDEVENILTVDEIRQISEKTDGFSGADVTSLCKDAAMWPIRRNLMSLSNKQIGQNPKVPPVGFRDFLDALKTIKATVAKDDLKLYENWNHQFGTNSTFEEIVGS